jgi:hypothetical protein
MTAAATAYFAKSSMRFKCLAGIHRTGSKSRTCPAIRHS